MNIIERLRPDPIPAIHPMPEYLATGQRAEWYEDIKSILQLPFVNTDYRTFARWPSYFAMAWNDLREKAGSPVYETICKACHDRVANLVATELPNPGDLSSNALRRAAKTDASLDEVIQVCRLFQWLLPGLITNVAYIRHQLEAVRRPFPGAALNKLQPVILR